MPSNINQQFVEAAQNNQLAKLKNLLSQGADIQANNDAALRWSASNGHFEIVKFLLVPAADSVALVPGASSCPYSMPQRQRLALGSTGTEVGSMAIIHGANIHANDDEALKLASANGYIEIVKLLVTNGANIHADDDEALRCSAGCGKLEIVKFLVTQGANIHAQDDEALKWAANNGHLETVEFLLIQGANIHAKNDCALRWSAQYGHFETVKFLITQGANIHANNDEALRWSAENGHLEIVKLLVATGANIHAQDDEVLKTAIKDKNEPILMLLNAFLNEEKLLVAASASMPVLPSASRCLCSIEANAATSGTAVVPVALVAALESMPQKLDNSINAKTNNCTITKSKRSKI